MLTNLSLRANEKMYLSKMEQTIMEDIEDNWIRPPLPYPIWSYDRQEKVMCIYDMERFRKVIEKYEKGEHGNS